MVLSDIEGSLFDRLGFGANPDSSHTRRIRRFINLTHREILGMKGFGRLRRAVLPFNSVSNSPFAVLPQAAVAIIAIADRTSNRILDELTLQDLRRRDPGMRFSSAIPDGYVVINTSAPVALDPTVPTELFVVSDSASDGPGVSASIEGTITGGYYRRATIGMVGLTQVSLDSSITTWEHVTKFYISGKATGNITLRQTVANQELSRIEPGRTGARYTQIQLTGTPSVAAQYFADVELHVEDMINPKDEPLIPEDFHELMEIGPLKREYSRREKPALWKIEQVRWIQGISDLRDFVTRKSGVARGPNAKSGFSQLGAYFSDGT